MFVSDSMPDAFDNCQVEDILKWSADQGAHCDVLKSLSGWKVREAFNMQPVMVPWWTNYLGQCQRGVLNALQQASDKSLAEVLNCCKVQGVSAPGRHSIAMEVVASSSGGL